MKITHTITLFVLVAMLACNTAAQTGKILFQDNFEQKASSTGKSLTGKSATAKWKKAESREANALGSSDSVARQGRNSMRIELNRKTAAGAANKRAELVTTPEKSMNIERWYKFSIFLPKDYIVDSVYEILAQWHEMPDTKLGETWRSPPISLQTNKGEWQCDVKWATERVNTNQTISGKKIIPLGAATTGVWADFIFHIKFSYTATGVLQIWKDGKQVVDYKGPNYYNDKKGPYFKIGIYKSQWENKINSKKSIVNKRVIYVDDVMIANEKAKLQDFLH